MSKLLEKIVYCQVYTFLNENNQLYESQYGFCNNHSCENAVGEVVSCIVKNLELNRTSIALFLDLSKAFDTLEHTLLLHKMERYGLRGTVLEWFKSYLSNRRIRLKSKPTSSGQTQTSAEYPVEYSMPQGSCLGPLIFLIFCNDLKLNLMFLHCVQFADDTTLITGHRNLHYLKYCIECDLEIIQDWFNTNKLTLNLSKSSYMIFQSNVCKTSNLNLTLNGATLPRTECTKFLGTWLDEKLVWTEHIKKLKTKLLSKLGLLTRSKRFLSAHAMKNLYYAQIHSNISYAISMWGPMANHCLINQIQTVQNKAVSCIEPGLKPNLLYCKHKILTVDLMINLELCKLGYRMTNNLLPEPLCHALQTDHHKRSTAKLHHYETRNKLILNLPRASHSRYRNSYLFKAISVYSKLPTEITNQPKLCNFTSKCKVYLQK